MNGSPKPFRQGFAYTKCMAGVVVQDSQSLRYCCKRFEIDER